MSTNVVELENSVDRHFNGLTPAEQERIALLAEELAETIQIVGKILRHGYISYHPDNPAMSNRSLLAQELGHVDRAMLLLEITGDVSTNTIARSSDAKAGDLRKWMHHQPEDLFTLERDQL